MGITQFEIRIFLILDLKKKMIIKSKVTNENRLTWFFYFMFYKDFWYFGSMLFISDNNDKN